MSRREDIVNTIWDDEDFDALSNDAALLYLWSFTNPKCGMSGLYRCKRRHLLEGRLEDSALADALAELEQSGHLYYVDGFVFVRTRVKHLRTRGGPMKKSIVNDLAAVPTEHPLRARFCDEYRHSWIASEQPESPSAIAQIEGVAGGSEGVPDNPITKPDSRTPSEPLGGFQGKGVGKGRGGSKGESRATTDQERHLAEQILASFNERAGSSFTIDAFLDRILDRIREHPELTEADYAEIIRCAFIDPWWAPDPPSPAVLFKSSATFEPAAEKARHLGNRPRGQIARDLA